ncbi:hypothetical protein H0H92_002441, partial [Tricholoma furcatifolium]
DISSGNVLINHFGRFDCDRKNHFRTCVRQQGRSTYALFDFDLSTKFPSSWSDQECRLPYLRSRQGTPGFVPPDTWQGEFDFNPFAFDVGALGMLLSSIYDVYALLPFVYRKALLIHVPAQHLVIHVPMLAPLFDKMLTRDIPRRFTAQQALDFLENEVYPRTTPTQLKIEPEPRTVSTPDRWAGLDPAFLKEWERYREPPMPLTTRFLRVICDYDWVYSTIAFFRKTVHLIRRADCRT